MTKQQLIETVKLRLKKVDETKIFDPRLLEQYISKAWNQLLYYSFQKGTSDLWTYSKEYKAQTITKDVDTNIYYTTLPAALANIPKKEKGVLLISTTQGSDVEFVPTNEKMLRYTRDLEIDLVDDTIYFKVYIQEGKVEYYNMTAAIAAAGVRMRLVIPFEEWADGDKLSIPEGRDQDLINWTVQFALGTPEPDLKSDN